MLARFGPVVRTFCPIVAGAGRMSYPTFARFNIAGAFIWAAGVTSLGYFLGNVTFVTDHVELALIGVVMSLLPIVVETLRSRRRHPEGHPTDA